jgi:hypothetical protein
MDKREEVWKHIPLIDLLQILKFKTDNLNSVLSQNFMCQFPQDVTQLKQYTNHKKV